MKYFSLSAPKVITWELLLLHAGEDYQNFLFLAYHKLAFGTALWMAWQSIEKYYKAFLLKHVPNVDLRKLGHDIGKLVAQAKELDEYSSLNLDDDELEWLSDISTPIDDPNTAIGDNHFIRYGSGVNINVSFHARFASVGMKLRKLILGGEEFKKLGTAGLPLHNTGGFAKGNKASSYYKEVMFPMLVLI